MELKSDFKGIYERNKGKSIIVILSGFMLILLYSANLLDLAKALIQWLFIGTSAIIINDEVHRKIKNNETK